MIEFERAIETIEIAKKTIERNFELSDWTSHTPTT